MDYTSAIVELWILYAIGAFFIGGRLFARYKLVGWKAFKPDDYLAIVLWVRLSTSACWHWTLSSARLRASAKEILTPLDV
jgi:hypothetical protein